MLAKVLAELINQSTISLPSKLLLSWMALKYSYSVLVIWKTETMSHTTVKFLVTIDTFTGVFMFVSEGFSGNSSDWFKVEHNGILISWSLVSIFYQTKFTQPDICYICTEKILFDYPFILKQG